MNEHVEPMVAWHILGLVGGLLGCFLIFTLVVAAVVKWLDI